MIVIDKFVIESCIKLLISIISGIILGLERKSHNHVIGMRTLILICVSACLMSILSMYMSNIVINGKEIIGEPSRITAGVINGIGFLGGGAIMRQGLNIKGLTSAGIIWTAASLGLAIGGGLYIQAAVVLFSVLFLLLFLEKIEGKFFPAGATKTLHLCYESEQVDLESIKKVIEENGLKVSDINMTCVLATKQIILHYSVKAPKEKNLFCLLDDLKSFGELSEFSITD